MYNCYVNVYVCMYVYIYIIHNNSTNNNVNHTVLNAIIGINMIIINLDISIICHMYIYPVTRLVSSQDFALLHGPSVYDCVRVRSIHGHTGVCEKHIPFTRAFALQTNSRNSSPAPDSVSKLIFPQVCFSRGVLSSHTSV